MSYFSLFQSPHPVRGATGSRSCWPPSQCHFNPRTPRGVRRLRLSVSTSLKKDFNPRTPRGVRRPFLVVITIAMQFQSTHPARGATHISRLNQLLNKISIHAPREGCDRHRPCIHERAGDFNPRTPRGVRPLQLVRVVLERGISIHAPREGCDCTFCRAAVSPALFQSTHPARGATTGMGRVALQLIFQSTHPARGATLG